MGFGAELPLQSHLFEARQEPSLHDNMMPRVRESASMMNPGASFASTGIKKIYRVVCPPIISCILAMTLAAVDSGVMSL